MSTEATQITIDGYYGVGNVGDEAILSCLLEQIRENFEEPKIIASSENPDHTRSNHSVDDAVERFEILGEKRDWITAVHKSDILIVGGGGLFSLNSYTTYCIKFLIALLFKTEIHIASMGGAEPANGFIYSKQLSILLSCADSISVRDDETKREFERVNSDVKIERLSDIVYSMEKPGQVSGEENQVLISVRQPKYRDFKIEALCDAIDQFYKKHDLEILVVPFNQNCSPSDREVADDVVSRLNCPAEVYTGEVRWEKATELISQSKMIIGMRLHSIILSAKMRKKFVGLSYERKCDAQLRSLGINKPMRTDELRKNELESTFTGMWVQNGISEGLEHRIRQLESDAEFIVPYIRQNRQNSVSTGNLVRLTGIIIGGLVLDALAMSMDKFDE